MVFIFQKPFKNFQTAKIFQKTFKLLLQQMLKIKNFEKHLKMWNLKIAPYRFNMQTLKEFNS